MSETNSTPSTPPPAEARTLPPFQYADLLDKGPFNDWRDDLARDGYAVVKGAIPVEEAAALTSRAKDWLESFGHGYKRDDPSTFGQRFLPIHNRGGMFAGAHYRFGQEQWVWDIRTAPGVVGAFEKLWGTNELVTSFDGGSLMLPKQGPKPGSVGSSWQHIDQHPARMGFFVAQGILNLVENGPEDGGLLVMKGSSRLMKQFFDLHGRPPIPDGRIDWHLFSDADKQWFLDQGCEWTKVCAGPGDLILWSSGTMHQNQPPTGDRERFVTYVCMGPAHLLTPEDKEMRKNAWAEKNGTTHTPFQGCWAFHPPIPVRPETGLPDEEFTKSKNVVKETDQIRKLAGVLPY